MPLIGIAIGFWSVRVVRVGPLWGSGADDVAVKTYQVLGPLHTPARRFPSYSA